MIILLVSKLQKNASIETMREMLCQCFPAQGNRKYFQRKISEKNEERALESLRSLLLLSSAIDLLPQKVNKQELSFSCDNQGKPFFKGSNIKFNVSHSKGFVVCCVSADSEVGVDIEASHIPPEKAVRLAKRYFNEAEIAETERSPESFTRLWSENEAEAKFLGKDLAMFFKENKQKNITANKRQNVYFHRFKAYNIPITVCTDSQHSTILFKIIQ